jgi:uncharacterized protein (TIGR03435 family)
MTWESQLLQLLSASLLRPFVLAAGALLILRIFRVQHPASQHRVWTAVLAGMLALPFVSAIAPQWRLPLLPPKPELARRVVTRADIAPLPAGIGSAPLLLPAASPRRPASADIVRLRPETILVGCYLTGLAAMLLYTLMGLALARRVIRRSTPVRGSRLRESGHVLVPIAVGLVRSAVIVPAGWREWSPRTRRAVLAHEFAHLHRKDTLTSALARIAQCLFWFHPLAWWTSRKIAELAELACDAVALERIGNPGEYSRVLLEFSGRINIAGSRITLPGLAMADSSKLGTRIDRIFEMSGGKMRRLGKPWAVLALIGVPAMCLAATAGLKPRVSPQPPTPSLPAAWPSAPSRPAPLLAQAQTSSPAPPQTAPAAARPDPAAARIAPRFEKASIAVAGPPVTGELCWGGCGGPGTPYPESQNEIKYRHFPLSKILQRAYALKEFQITVPSAFEGFAYDIEATAPVGVTKDQFQLMLRNLLTERLHLAVHSESKEFITSYELVVAPGGPNLKVLRESDDSPPSQSAFIVPVPGINLSVNRNLASAAILSLFAEATLGTYVTDKTGLTGKYELDFSQIFPSPGGLTPESFVRFKPARVDTGAAPARLPELRAKFAQLGLALEEKRATFDSLIVDHVDEVPSRN